MEKIICKKCGVSKEANNDNFYWRKDSNKWRSECKECILIRRQNYFNNNKEKISKYRKVYRKNNSYKIKNYMIEYNSKPKVKARMVKYRQDNKKVLREKEREWRKKNPEKAKAIANRKSAVQRKKSLNRVRYNISRAVNIALKRSESSKAGESVIKHLSYSLKDLKSHLESQFEDWMNWNNYGSYRLSVWDDNDKSTWTWQIDHIICQADLPYDSMEHPNFKKCWALENLRPYSSKQNCLDGANKIRNNK